MSSSTSRSALALSIYHTFHLVSLPFLLIIILTPPLSHLGTFNSYSNSDTKGVGAGVGRRNGNKIKRTATWYNFIISWIVFATISVLLVGKVGSIAEGNGGGIEDGIEFEYEYERQREGIPFSLCLFQAAAICASRIFIMFTMLSLLIQLYHAITISIYDTFYHRYWIWVLTISPYVMALTILVIGLIHGVRNPAIIEPQSTGMYCHFQDTIVILSSSLLLLAASICMFMVLGMILCLIHWSYAPSQKAQINPMIKRLCICITGGAVVIGLSLTSVIPIPKERQVDVDMWSNLLVAPLPLVVAVLFGTLPDNMNVWTHWLSSIFVCGGRRRRGGNASNAKAGNLSDTDSETDIELGGSNTTKVGGTRPSKSLPSTPLTIDSFGPRTPATTHFEDSENHETITLTTRDVREMMMGEALAGRNSMTAITYSPSPSLKPILGGAVTSSLNERGEVVTVTSFNERQSLA